MIRNPVTIWIALSFTVWIIGSIWGYFSSDELAFFLNFLGWVSSLIAVGYYSTPAGSLYGKFAFASIVVMVTGIAFKILHFFGSNELIIAGLAGLVITYSVRWIKERKLL